MEQWRITSGEVEAHNRAVKAHPGAVEGLQASVADFYHSNEDPRGSESGPASTYADPQQRESVLQR